MSNELTGDCEQSCELEFGGTIHMELGNVRGLVVGLAGGERRKGKVNGCTLRCTVDRASQIQW